MIFISFVIFSQMLSFFKEINNLKYRIFFIIICYLLYLPYLNYYFFLFLYFIFCLYRKKYVFKIKIRICRFFMLLFVRIHYLLRFFLPFHPSPLFLNKSDTLVLFLKYSLNIFFKSAKINNQTENMRKYF